MGAPPTGLPVVVKRRIENRVTGVRARTDRRSLETIGSNVKGSRQSDRGHVTQRPKTGGKKKFSRGLDNSGNIEGSLAFYPAAATARLWPASAGGRCLRAAMAAPLARHGCLPWRRAARRGAA